MDDEKDKSVIKGAMNEVANVIKSLSDPEHPLPDLPLMQPKIERGAVRPRYHMQKPITWISGTENETKSQNIDGGPFDEPDDPL